ncbi:MAG TPA: toll/interleukin-1 receptor domain-containing protein [Pyrinomonadaceae bacterium]|jgi:hypothetical protein
MKPWTYEADQINIGDLEDIEKNKYIVKTQEIREFLKVGRDDKKMFLVAPKGLGKTLLMKVKSQLYKDKAPEYFHIPRKGLVEKFTKSGINFSKEDLDSFTQQDIWEKTWELCLLTLILVNVDIEEIIIPKEIIHIIGNAKRLPEILGTFLRNRGEIEKIYDSCVNKILTPALGELSDYGVNQIAVFIDNIDEFLEDHTGYLYTSNPKTHSPDIWVNAQLGIITAIRKLTSLNNHLKIFVSLRQEAFNKSYSSTTLQTEDYMTFLKYTQEQVKEIFEQNIEITDEKDLVDKDNIDPLTRFLGFSILPHKFVLDENGNKKTEKIFNYLYRHTLGRPREIVKIGSELAKISPSERNQEKICETVNETSHKLLESYKTEIIPYFPDNVFDLFCSLIESNAISYDSAVEISEKIKLETKFENVFSYLYKLGLVGITVGAVGEDNKKVQKFLPVGEKSLSALQIPELRDTFYVIHSLIDETLKNKHGSGFYNRDNIIGYNYPFQKPRIRKEGMLHVHFGLHRDGLSLVLPELVKFKKIALICNKEEIEQRCAEDSSSKNRLILQTSNNDQIEFYLKSNNLDDQEALFLWEKGKHLFVMSDDKEIIAKLLTKCETISIVPDKYFDKNIETLKQHLNNRSKKVYLYVCQREPTDQYLLKRQLNAPHKIEIKDAFTDRLLLEEECFEKDEALILNVKTENYGSFIYPERENSSTYQNKVLLKTKSKEEHNFYRDRQKYIVNGIYSLTKIARLDELRNNSKKNDCNNIFTLFFDIQIKRLLEKHKNVIKKVFSGISESDSIRKLEEFCQINKLRFSELQKLYNPIHYESYVNNIKQKRIFPNDTEFYKYVRRSAYFTDTPAVIKLKNLLEIKEAKNYKSVFISYSFKDEIFAKKIHDSFVKRGIRVFLFQKDDPSGYFTHIMERGVDEHDILLFIASENSIKSNACHFELTAGRKKYERTWNNQIFLPIRIDNSILNIKFNEIPEIENRNEMWTNIEELKKINTKDFSKFNDNKVTKDYENSVDTLINFLQTSKNK